MTTFKTRTLPAKDAGWQAIGSKPFIEISMCTEHSHHKKDQLLKTTSKQENSASKEHVRKLGDDNKSSFCNAAKIPGKLFEKNEKLLSFVGHISCS